MIHLIARAAGGGGKGNIILLVEAGERHKSVVDLTSFMQLSSVQGVRSIRSTREGIIRGLSCW